MSRLTHPNTVRVHLFGQLDGGALYIVMEFLEGENILQVERRDGPMHPDRAFRIMMQICGALHEAHTQGIVHRDLKPENIVLTTQGGIADFPKVLDFGLAKMNDPDPQTGSVRALTQAGAVFGTPEFMSPEQARGEVLDARSDIYSLCVILYEMMTCKLPFKAKTPMDFIAKHIKADPIPVHERIPGLPLLERHWAVMEKALRKNRDDRYATAQEFADALESIVNGKSGTVMGMRIPGPPQSPAGQSLVPALPVSVPALSQKAARPAPVAPDAEILAPGVHTSAKSPAGRPAGPAAAVKAEASAPAADPVPALVADDGRSGGTISKGAIVGIGVGLGVLFIAVVTLVIMLL